MTTTRERVRDLLDAGMPVSEIAIATDVTRSRVHQLAKLLALGEGDGHSTWTDERVDLLRKLVGEGNLTYSQIAEKIGGGLSRNACIGKALRIGLAGKPTPPRIDCPRLAPAAPKERMGPRIVALALEGSSPVIIAERLGTNNRSVSVALSKARAAGVKIPYVQVHKPRPRKSYSVKHPPAGKPAPVFVDAAPPASALMLTLMQIDDKQCHWPYGDPKGPSYGYCGHPVEQGAYCGAHVRLMWPKGTGSDSVYVPGLGKVKLTAAA